MGFVMDGLDAEAYDRDYSDRVLLRRILGYFRPQTKRMLFVAGMILLTSLVDMALPLLLSRGVTQMSQSITMRNVILLVSAFLLAAALSWCFNFFRQWYTNRIVGDVVLQMRENVFGAVMQRDMSFFDEFSSGKIVSRVTSDTQDFATVVTLTLSLLSQVLLVVLIVGVLFYIDAQLAWLTMIMVPLVIAAALSFRYIARLTTQRAQRASAQVNANVQEMVSGIAIAKNFRQEQTIYNDFKTVNEQFYQVQFRQGLVFSSIFPVLVAIAGIGTVIVVYFGGRTVLSNRLSAGEWYLFVQAVSLFWFPLTSIASFWSQFQLGLSASERVFALIDAEPRVVQTGHDPIPVVRGRIEFRHVDFHYTEQETVLTDFNLTIQAGETVALVGHTGAGKSSLGKLVARFYEFNGGQLLIDDKDIRSFDLNSYRRHLGIVPQTPFLFSGTVASNIRYACPEASDAEVMAVARQIGGGDWLDVLPGGLETEVGEEGNALSMGQRQLVALARILLQNPSILILDEATASVDPLTEAQIQESLEVVLAQRTAIVIAHRLSTIKQADRIIVLRKGEIIEEGNHEALMARGGHYAELYNTYFRHQSLEYINSWNRKPMLGPIAIPN
jgi:ABC-type multidrug transport system fused ATPase/permease subunit